jgi:uncharacterized protein YjiS (DUF1127 family)
MEADMIVVHFAWTLDRLLNWLERRRQRRVLLGLEDRMLKDIGVSRCDLERGTRDRRP